MMWVSKAVPLPGNVERLMQELGAPKEIAYILCQRGIDDPEKVRHFFNPKLSGLHDPFLMKDMTEAVSRIEQAITSGEKVMIYGDYDVDGTTSVALVYSFFKSRFKNCDYYIPDRYKEGYGISKQGIDHAISKDISLMIALDCGIRSIELTAYAKSQGLDLIICDHHLPASGSLPEAAAVLDPKRPDCKYPFKELSGCGIGFKLCQAYSQKNGLDRREYLRYLDLLVLSIASDIVPIIGENRILAYYGLKLINQQASPGLKKLIAHSVNKEKLDIGDLVFYLGPRINAAGRMEDAAVAVQLLISEQEDEAEELAKKLNIQNAHRKTVDEKITADLKEIVAKNQELLQRKSLVFYDPSWHKGVIGIAASRAIELYYRPTIILTNSQGILAGSGRSIKGFDLHEALERCKAHLIQFGGHTYAAGMSMLPSELDAFRAAFEAVAQEMLKEEDLIPKLYYDVEINPNQIDNKLLNIIQKMAPFGPGNMTPVFYAKQLQDKGNGAVIGKTAEHLRLNILQENGSIAAVGFGLASKLENIKKASSFEACFQIQENIFRGERSLQLQLKDINPTFDNGNTFSLKD